jgi:dihydroxyacetone kinase-like protein
MALTVQSLRTGIGKVRAVLETEYVALSELDGTLGDGDLGLTLVKAFRQLEESAPSLEEDLGRAFGRCAMDVTKVASSSFGTLLATSLLAAAKATKGQTAVPWSALSTMLEDALAAMMARGKANLGEKTVLDAVAACANAVKGIDDPGEQRAKAVAAVDAALREFHGRPCMVGRARIFGDKTIGMDDPGMVAFRTMLGAL